jgi:predicted transcriptional regulator
MTELTLSISPEAAARLDAEAQARGVTRETIAAEALEAVMWQSENLDWAEDERRLEEPGENIPLDEAFARFRAKVAAARAKAE